MVIFQGLIKGWSSWNSSELTLTLSWHVMNNLNLCIPFFSSPWKQHLGVSQKSSSLLTPPCNVHVGVDWVGGPRMRTALRSVRLEKRREKERERETDGRAVGKGKKDDMDIVCRWRVKLSLGVRLVAPFLGCVMPEERNVKEWKVSSEILNCAAPSGFKDIPKRQNWSMVLM